MSRWWDVAIYGIGSLGTADIAARFWTGQMDGVDSTAVALIATTVCMWLAYRSVDAIWKK